MFQEFNEENGSGKGIERKVKVGMTEGLSSESFICYTSPEFEQEGPLFTRADLSNYLSRVKTAGYQIVFVSETTPLGRTGVKVTPLTKEDESYFRKELGL